MTETCIKLTEEQFDEQYPLVPNHLNPNATWGYADGKGCLFETYGEELEFIKRQNRHRVWTILRSGGTSNGTSYQISGKGEASHSTSSNWSDNWAQHGRKLLKPEEVLALPSRMAITFTPGVPPVWTSLVRHYEESFPLRQGWWARFKTSARTACFTASLLFMALMFGVVIVDNSFRRMPVESTSIQNLPRKHPTRKAGKTWQHGTFSR